MHAVGVHVFAGGFTQGVKRVIPVECQLETHGFALETAEAVAQVPCVNEPQAKWPRLSGQLCFGNPRCTGFSCVTAGCSESAHGAWSKQTIDVHQLCEYAAGHFDVIVWESVQQAYTVGRELLDYLRDEIFAPKHYRIAHVMVNAASFWNTQHRKRYFFVAYRDDRNFCVQPPRILPWYPVSYDVLWSLRDRECHSSPLWKATDYTHDSYMQLVDWETDMVPYLPNGWSLNSMGKYAPHLFRGKPAAMWSNRMSDMPFSMHSIARASYLRPFPTLTSSAGRIIHPEFNRPVTVGELSAIMGWSDIPRGPHPVAQLAKGVVPDVGEWIAQQCKLYLEDHWGDQDWESAYDPSTGTWVGDDASGKREKFFDLTRYVGKSFDRERYEVTDEVLFRHRLHVDGRPKTRV